MDVPNLAHLWGPFGTKNYITVRDRDVAICTECRAPIDESGILIDGKVRRCFDCCRFTYCDVCHRGYAAGYDKFLETGCELCSGDHVEVYNGLERVTILDWYHRGHISLAADWETKVCTVFDPYRTPETMSLNSSQELFSDDGYNGNSDGSDHDHDDSDDDHDDSDHDDSDHDHDDDHELNRAFEDLDNMDVEVGAGSSLCGPIGA